VAAFSDAAWVALRVARINLASIARPLELWRTALAALARYMALASPIAADVFAQCRRRRSANFDLTLCTNLFRLGAKLPTVLFAFWAVANIAKTLHPHPRTW
jgi:hypothetical protein